MGLNVLNSSPIGQGGFNMISKHLNECLYLFEGHYAFVFKSSHSQICIGNYIQMFGTQQDPGKSQALIIPYHPHYTGCNPLVAEDTQIPPSLVQSPNWLPGLPQPPPGIIVEPPRNRSKRERLRCCNSPFKA